MATKPANRSSGVRIYFRLAFPLCSIYKQRGCLAKPEICGKTHFTLSSWHGTWNNVYTSLPKPPELYQKRRELRTTFPLSSRARWTTREKSLSSMRCEFRRFASTRGPRANCWLPQFEWNCFWHSQFKGKIANEILLDTRLRFQISSLCDHVDKINKRAARLTIYS